MNNNYTYSKKIFTFILIIYFSLGSKVFGTELDALFVHLKNAQNPIIAQEFENQIWKFWINIHFREKQSRKNITGAQTLLNVSSSPLTYQFTGMNS